MMRYWKEGSEEIYQWSEKVGGGGGGGGNKLLWRLFVKYRKEEKE